MKFGNVSLKLVVAAAALVGASTAATAVTVVNLDGLTNASTDGTNAVTINLAGGRYEARFVADLFTAHNRFSGTSSGCDVNGTNCVRGWETNARIHVGPNDFDDSTSLRLGNFTYHATRELAFAASAAFVREFIVPAGGGPVNFYIFDPLVRDNREGVSIGIAAVPEMATWAMMIAGFGLVGVAARRRRPVAATV